MGEAKDKELAADRYILELAGESGKLALEVGYAFKGEVSHIKAFERGLIEDWFRLIDISPVADYPGKMFRIFLLTEKGWARRKAVSN